MYNKTYDYIANHVLQGILKSSNIEKFVDCGGVASNDFDMFHIEVKFDSDICDCSYLVNDASPLLSSIGNVKTVWLEFDTDSENNKPSIFFNPKGLTPEGVSEYASKIGFDAHNYPKIASIADRSNFFVGSLAFFLQRESKNVKTVLLSKESPSIKTEDIIRLLANLRLDISIKLWNMINNVISKTYSHTIFIDINDLSTFAIEVAPENPTMLLEWEDILAEVEYIYPEAKYKIDSIKESFGEDENFKAYIHHVKFTYNFHTEKITAKVYFGVDKK